MSGLRRVCAVVVVMGAVAAVAATTPPGAATQPVRARGVELWSLKMLSDPQRFLVNLHPVLTTVAAINRLPRPIPTPRTRSTVYERRKWRVKAQIVQYKLEEDSDIHLVLYYGGAYMIAELPSPSCLPFRTRARRTIVAARRLFERRCGPPD